MYNANPFIKGTSDADFFICSSIRHSRSRTIFILNSNKTDWNVILFMYALHKIEYELRA